MPTRQGWTITAGGVISLLVGRVFGILELYVVGTGLLVAVISAVLVVRLRRPEISIGRWVHPSVLTVGDTGRVDLGVRNDSPYRSPRVDLAEPVGPINTARMTLSSLLPGDQVTAGYRIPATSAACSRSGRSRSNGATSSASPWRGASAPVPTM